MCTFQLRYFSFKRDDTAPSDIPANMANTSAGRASESQEKKEENTRGWSQPPNTGELQAAGKGEHDIKDNE